MTRSLLFTLCLAARDHRITISLLKTLTIFFFSLKIKKSKLFITMKKSLSKARTRNSNTKRSINFPRFSHKSFCLTSRNWMHLKWERVF